MSHKPNSPRLGRGCIVASLCTATVLWVAAAELDAAPINFTSSSRFAQAPTSDGAAGSLVVAGIPGTPGPSLLDGPNGFSYTDVQLTYTAPLADVGNLIRITWRILRDFTEPAAAFTNTSILSGVVTLEVDMGQDFNTGLSLRTEHVNEPIVSAAIASSGLLLLGPTAGGTSGVFTRQFFNTASTDFQHGGGADMLEQVMLITLFPRAQGQRIVFFFPGSADSLTVAPEPSMVILLGLGMFALKNLRRPRRQH